MKRWVVLLTAVWVLWSGGFILPPHEAPMWQRRLPWKWLSHHPDEGSCRTALLTKGFEVYREYSGFTGTEIDAGQEYLRVRWPNGEHLVVSWACLPVGLHPEKKADN